MTNEERFQARLRAIPFKWTPEDVPAYHREEAPRCPECGAIQVCIGTIAGFPTWICPTST